MSGAEGGGRTTDPGDAPGPDHGPGTPHAEPSPDSFLRPDFQPGLDRTPESHPGSAHADGRDRDALLAGPLPATLPPVRTDPWAHRRGEPRVFAFFWTFYVLLSVAGSLLWVARSGAVTIGAYTPAARVMLVVVAIGMTVLWPMTRLSQASPRGSAVAAAAADLFVVLVPVQMVVWPLALLAGWPPDIIGALGALFMAWAFATGGAIALALAGRRLDAPRDPRLVRRSGWMAAILCALGGAPLALWIYAATRSPAPHWLPMASPITAVPSLTGRGFMGPMEPVGTDRWVSLAVLGLIGAALWGAAIVRSLLASRREAA